MEATQISSNKGNFTQLVVYACKGVPRSPEKGPGCLLEPDKQRHEIMVNTNIPYIAV